MHELLRRMLFLPPEASHVARSVDDLHFVVIGITMGGAFLVGLVTLMFLIRYHARREGEPTPKVHGPRGLELTVGGGLFILFVLLWVVGFRQYVDIRTPPGNSLEVYVTAKQWMWKFSTLDGRRSAGVLVVPQGRAIRLIITSRDVVHSFYLPAFRIKQDAVPGRYTTLWFKPERLGTYPVYCAEYCGTNHSRMWASVVVLSGRDYNDWMSGQMPEAVEHAGTVADLGGGAIGEQGLTSMEEQGRTAASRYGCLSCHTIDGQRHIGPSWRGLYGKTEQLEHGRTVVADEDYLTRSMMEPLADVVQGYPPVMPVYQGVLAQPDAAAIVEFIKSLRFDQSLPLIALPRLVPAPTSSAPTTVETAAGASPRNSVPVPAEGPAGREQTEGVPR